ncbi:probable NAD kinase (polyphosphate/ATP) [Natronomonas pharaonis DSM 2160]|uniref:NAD kinase n=1 Tax=Natronomonas pharaonis (strain ATCC 35678 / DSM 2160 / CIP 103997 / JCM 8858 / NBRC 14720 / NCIMB 2260 / Gabara) TaxID=348780 RepID=NADK_NATPD|nr:NAD(+)/NADH kinase [Natronomonas pharaonis]Q3IR96.1 RecName: Full=NAD kinase; AltName: Full=ATP-dependent NAD kinase [Natronomonas pharaonis DSM 2160]CAI49347.1 probable NAD kinase (polyphosphate/ATP) [Natronomonas pharaonis DSM 2160]
MELGIVAKRETPRAVELADRIRRHVDVPVTLDNLTADELDANGTDVTSLSACDLVVSIGGDGTFLFAAREVSPTPVLGVNLGEVGFLNAVSPEECVETVAGVVERMQAGDAELQELPQLQATGPGLSLPAAVNEVAVLGPQRGRDNGLDIDVRVNGEGYSSGRADGVLVSTPTGSTAYNLSEGGPIVHPDVSAFVVTEMCAESSMPSLAVPTDRTITVHVDGADHAVVAADGRTRSQVAPPAEITLAVAADPVRIAGPKLEFFTALDKLD